MSKDQKKFIYDRAVPLGKYMVVADVKAPLPVKGEILTDDNVQITLSVWLTKKGSTYYRTGISAQPASVEQHAKVINYVTDEGFIDHLCLQLHEDWSSAQEMITPTYDDASDPNIVDNWYDADNRRWTYDEEKKELFAAAIEDGFPSDGYEASDENNIF